MASARRRHVEDAARPSPPPPRAARRSRSRAAGPCPVREVEALVGLLLGACDPAWVWAGRDGREARRREVGTFPTSGSCLWNPRACRQTSASHSLHLKKKKKKRNNMVTEKQLQSDALNFNVLHYLGTFVGTKKSTLV